jgi:ParB-like chromosome segregation protein Spo0J
MSAQLAMFGELTETERKELLTSKEQIEIDNIKTYAGNVFAKIEGLSIDAKVEVINQLKLMLHHISPMRNEPVDCVLWVRNESVYANDYNPNSVAPPEMELLKDSILEDGYTQPIVSFINFDEADPMKQREVVDGFHRNRVGKEYSEIKTRVHGYLPVVSINEGVSDKSDRMASTIRHNRARGKHKIESMSDIVMELKKRNWSDEKIAKKLGMDPDEVLRLAQITGLAEMFVNQEFSQAWEAHPVADEVIEEL